MPPAHIIGVLWLSQVSISYGPYIIFTYIACREHFCAQNLLHFVMDFDEAWRKCPSAYYRDVAVSSNLHELWSLDHFFFGAQLFLHFM